MGKQIFGFHTATLGNPRFQVGLAVEQLKYLQVEKEEERNPAPVAPDYQAKLYALSVPKRGQGTPRVGEYDNTPTGHKELASLVRSEHVLSVVLGRLVKFEHSSVVELASDGVTVTEKLVLPE